MEQRAWGSVVDAASGGSIVGTVLGGSMGVTQVPPF